MGIVPSDATDGTEIQDFETLEARLYNTKRDKESEVRKSVRLEDWQMSLIGNINNEHKTNTVEVISRAYVQGLKHLRDLHESNARDIVKMRISVNNFFEEYVGKKEYVRDVEKMLYDNKVNDPLYDERGDMEPRYAYVRDSVLSEVNKYFIEWCLMGGWIHRSIIAIGLGYSEKAGKRTEDYVQREIDEISRIIDEMRVEMEDVFAKYLGINTTYWVQNGLEDEHLETMKDVMDSMETEAKKDVKDTIEILDEMA